MNFKTILQQSWRNLLFKLKRHFAEVLQSSNSDRSIAWGYTLGSFVTILPTPGVSGLLALGLIAIFKNLNKASVFIAVAFWNPVTVIPIYWLSLQFGEMIFEGAPTLYFKFEVLNQIYEYTRKFLVGNLMVSLPLAVVNYHMSLLLVGYIRRKRASRNRKR